MVQALEPASSSDGIVVVHAGYRQMRIIEEKRGNYKAAIDLCRRAKTEAWRDPSGIARLEKRMARAAKSQGTGDCVPPQRQL